jgi:outer membrane PBP1 activator LpoA protein
MAADAMRAGDEVRAERALDTLAEALDPRTRDAARLARAQLWLAEGREREARAQLTSLASAGATAFIRQRARDALADIR